MELVFNGNVNDLLCVSDDNQVKMTRLMDIDKTDEPELDEIMTIDIVSTSPSGVHQLFDELLDRKITVTISIDK